MKKSFSLLMLSGLLICSTAAVLAPAAEQISHFSGKSFYQEQKIFAETAVADGAFLKLVLRWEEIKKSNASTAVPLILAKDAKGNVLRTIVRNSQRRAFDADNAAIVHYSYFAAMPGHPDANSASFSLPKGTAKIALGVIFAGNPQTIRPVEFSATKLERFQKPANHHYPQLPQGVTLTDAELDAKLAARERLAAKLVTVGDTVTMQINGKVVPPVIYKTSPSNKPNRYPLLREFTQYGFNIFVLPVSLTARRPGDIQAWRDDGTIDAEVVRQQIRAYLKYNPDSMFFLEMSVVPPRSWALAHPDEIYRFEDGSFGLMQGARMRVKAKTVEECPANCYSMPSYASDAYIADASKALKQLFAELEKFPESKAVIGVYLQGGTDGQWLDLWDNNISGRGQADYSPAALRGFRRYLKEKYKDISALNKAWQSSSASFDAIFVPSSEVLWNTKQQYHSIGHASLPTDYKEFCAWCGGRRATSFARAVKEGSSGRILTGSYSPNSGLSGYPLISQQCLKYLLDVPELDFFAVVPGYQREYCDPIDLSCYFGSLRAHNKLLISELDLRSGDVQNWGYWGSDHWNLTHNSARFDYDVMRFALDAFARGGGYHAYDMDAGWFNTPNAKATWKKSGELAAAVKPMALTADRIALIAGENYWDFQSFGKGRLTAYMTRIFPMDALACSGVPYDIYLADDIVKHPEIPLPKVVIFSDASTMTPEQILALRKRLFESNRVVVWMGRPALFASGTDNRIAALFGEKRNSRADHKLPWSDGKSSDPLMKNNGGYQFAQLPFYSIECPEAVEVRMKGGKTLCTYFGTDIPAAQVRRFQNGTEVVLALPGSLTPQFCRNLAREAKFAPLFESDELFSFGGGYLAIAPLSDGVKTITLPPGVKVKKIVSKQQIDIADNKIKVTLKRGEIFIAQIEQ